MRSRPVCRVLVGRPLVRRPRRNREEGQISVLILGLFALCLALILGATDVTAAQLARMRLLDAADSAALDAADALDEAAAYRGGLHGTLLLTDASVQQSAAAHLARIPRPSGITAWGLDAPTGSEDGQTAVVTLTGRASLPMSGWLLERFGGGVTITVRSRARAPLG
ncbi:MAG TPA: pilus assembly protein TadG-related protein [Intrasporangium sp.]|uniref:pilus assembly protein TadG-related protein n=1 Tax=Intrasporangium sp. TaxID=1925024 RepID=UPI002D772AC6|nr:pilus assembly protein TadG-related protein [Intrasporangium sp.]HET7397779.1 pilus assembly protein TadG-related protein [Intrasporangium sp.]